MRPDDEVELYEYIRRTKPFIVVMAPQCTGLAGWGNFNQKMNPEAHQRSVAISLHLGRICAKCAILQLESTPRRHFFAEQPADSVLYLEPEWVYVAHISGVTWTYMDMCMAGLRSRLGYLLKKPSELWASHEILLLRFRRMICDGRHQHVPTEGGESRLSQIWTWLFARVLADGVEDLIRFETAVFYLTHFPDLKYTPPEDFQAYPAGDRRGVGGRPQLSREVGPEEIDEHHPRWRWSCRACRNSIEKHSTLR